jgi:hypothetical protein
VCGREHAGQAFQEGALARAVRSDERRRFTGIEPERDIVERRTILEVDAQVLRPEPGRAPIVRGDERIS